MQKVTKPLSDNLKSLIRHIYPGLLCGIIIMVLISLPGSCFPRTSSYWIFVRPDKVVHGVMFAVFTFSIIWGYRHEYCEKDKHYRITLQLITFSIAVFYAGLTEVIQIFIPYREGNWGDFLADVIGCVLGICIFKLIFIKKMIKKSSPIQ
ncbi:MAG: VanZ family protein [Bacteroidales bacterium]|nr:VanZ family protein [Bacteroidales bacterium]MBQ4205039.1 VanZ family protein [Bacteroidales bacterium]MCR5036865.1 VanZ family protein [Bacteroidales bacterium]